MLKEGFWDEMDSWPRARLDRYWTRRIRRVLDVAYNSLPFYQRRFQQVGFSPSQFRSLDDLRRLPVTERGELLNALKQAGRYPIGIERGHEEVVLCVSSGTEGDVIFLSFPRQWADMERQATLRAHWWAGLRPGGPILISAPAWHIYALGQNLLARALPAQAVIVWGTYSPEFASHVLQAIRAFSPQFLGLFLPFVFSLVAEARRRGLGPSQAFQGVKNLMVVGAPITPALRRHLQELTGVERVVEAAGSSEGLLAVECEVGQGLHLVPEKSVVEVLDAATYDPIPAGQQGAVVITNTWPWGPLYIRYATGDLGVMYPGECPCGRPSPRIKVMGRRSHLLRVGQRSFLPYDVQQAMEEAVGLVGATFAVLWEGLAKGCLHLLVQEEGIDARAVRSRLKKALEDYLDVPVKVEWAPSLPMRWKGVPPVIRREEMGGR